MTWHVGVCRICGGSARAPALPPSERGISDPHETRNSPGMCYHAKFGRHNERSKKSGSAGHRPLGYGHSFPTCRIWSFYRQTVRAHIWRSAEKWVLTSCPSRSLEVIGTDSDRLATCIFLLLIRCNHRHVSYRFSRQTAISVESRQFSLSPVYLSPR